MKLMMKTAAALLVAGGLATPALAANMSNEPNAPMKGDQMNSPKQTNLRQQLTNDLTKAGFTEIKVMPESFLVHAKDSKGNPVIMVVNPDSFTAVTEVSAPNTKAAGAGNTSGDKVMNGANANGDPTPPAKQ